MYCRVRPRKSFRSRSISAGVNAIQLTTTSKRRPCNARATDDGSLMSALTSSAPSTISAGCWPRVRRVRLMPRCTAKPGAGTADDAGASDEKYIHAPFCNRISRHFTELSGRSARRFTTGPAPGGGCSHRRCAAPQPSPPGERRQLGSPGVIANLFRPFAAGDGAGYRVEHQDPTQRKLAHGDAGGHELPDFSTTARPSVVVQSRKCLANIEGLALAIELAVVISGKGGVAPQLAGK